MSNLTKEEILIELDNVECPWVVCDFKDGPTVFRCRFCNKTEPLPTGKSLDWTLNLCRAFKMTHWNCEKQEEKE